MLDYWRCIDKCVSAAYARVQLELDATSACKYARLSRLGRVLCIRVGSASAFPRPATAGSIWAGNASTFSRALSSSSRIACFADACACARMRLSEPRCAKLARARGHLYLAYPRFSQHSLPAFPWLVQAAPKIFAKLK